MLLKIGLDLNDVVFDTNEMKRCALEAVTPLSIPQESFRGKASIQMGAWYQFKGSHNGRSVEPKEWDRAMKHLHEVAYSNLATLMSGAAEAIKRLSEVGHEVGIVTSTLGLDEDMVWEALDRFNLPISFVRATKSGPKTPHYEKCTAIIDNQARHLLAVTKPIQKILFLPKYEPDQPESSYSRLSAHVCVARGWEEVLPQLLPLAA